MLLDYKNMIKITKSEKRNKNVEITLQFSGSKIYAEHIEAH